MPADPKVLDRIEKLLRLAAPTSGTTEAERSSAALELVRLMSEHNVSVRGEEAAPPPRRRAPVSRNVWMPSRALQHCSCSYCTKLIAPGDIIWIRVTGHRVENRHNYTPCSPE